MSLKPIDPDHVLELYLADRENSVTQATLYSHRSRLGHFIRWCNEEGITHTLQEGWPMKTVGDRANVSETVLSIHYDSHSEPEKMEQRRDYLDDL